MVDSFPDRGMRAEFDLFISHASEDKDDFVRPLASALEAMHLRPWYDEFTLRPGDSLRRSIDHGLLTSQAGIVVLSEAFFAKRWPAYELDGLVQLYGGEVDQVAGAGRGSRIIPVWHGVDAEAVRSYSPSLANLIALDSRDGVERVAGRIFQALRPAGSTLLFAHAELSELGEPHGWHPPVVTDDWWLDVAAAAGRIDTAGTGRQPTGWDHWGFPLPDHGTSPHERGHRLARAAAQMLWQRAAASREICQVTPPEAVLRFIEESPGLLDACTRYPEHLLSYAPQLALPGAAGRLKPAVEQAYREAAEHFANPEWHEARRAIAERYAYLVLRDVDLVIINRAEAARHWVQGGLDGAWARTYDVIDYAAWLTSSSSSWMGDRMRAELLRGMGSWGAWLDWYDPRTSTVFLPKKTTKSELSPQESKLFYEAVVLDFREALVARVAHTAQMLSLPEAAGVLADQLMPLLPAEWPDRHAWNVPWARRPSR
jgi:hypothetical protein